VPLTETDRRFHLHLVSDATGETINSVARACLVQFEDIVPTEHTWSLIRTSGQMEKVLIGIRDHPGIVLFTIVNSDLREQLTEGCRKLQHPCIAVLDPVLIALANFLGQQALAHDDGQSARNYEEADVILVGVSRTSKTPTCIYLANRGIKAANVPIVPGCPMPGELLTAKKALIIGLTKDPTQLIHIRRNRLRLMGQDDQTDYVDADAVREEVAQARRLCTEHGWPMLDVTRRSIEETAASIIQLLSEQRGTANGAP
jgi:regulator of PEP synthase PpsR (kinase-PPPase family)